MLRIVSVSLLFPLLFASGGPPPVGAGMASGNETNQSESDDITDKKEADEPKDELSVTHHTWTAGDREIDYTATAGRIVLKTEEDEAKASVFFVAYTEDDLDEPAERPITFCFNGGPGSSSVWLHLGMLGPKRVQIPDDATQPAPPYRLIPNRYSLLDETDLVFIDPVSTGYSRAAEDEDPKQFHGYEEDIESVGQFIHLYVTRNKRWLSPKFLLGESYGSTRAAGLSGHLQERYNMYLNGIALVSSVLNFQTLRFDDNNDLPYILFLPSYTATAWYHERLPDGLQADLEKTLAKVEKFAMGPYAHALRQGADLSKRKRRRIAEKLARYTGLSPEYVEQTNLRITTSRFTKELLRNQRRTVGRLDSRFKGIDRDAAGDSYEYDPSGAAINGVFTATLNHYIRDELKFESDLSYEVLTGRVHPWSYDRFENRYVDAAETLRSAMTQNPHLRLFVASGYYDLATPYLASKYTVNHLALDLTLREHVTMGYYPAGHMMYIHDPSLKRLKQDLSSFYDGAAGE